MSTEHIKYSLLDFITGHLSEYDYEQVRRHLGQCFECRNHYNELMIVHETLQRTQKIIPGSTYFSTILPRVQRRLLWDRDSLLTDTKIRMRYILPLAVSALFLILIIRIPNSSLEHEQSNDLFQVVKDYSADEVVQAVSNEYAASNTSSIQEVVSDGISEHMQGDHFIKTALVRQMESDEIIDMDIEGVLSVMSKEQAEQLLLRFNERDML